MILNKTKNDILNKKLKTPEEIREILNNKKCISGVLGGCFDITHPGHLDLIARSKGYQCDNGDIIDIVIIGLNSDESVKILKGPKRPIINETDRSFLLCSLEYIDYVTIFSEPVIDNVLKTILPTYFIKSDQYSYNTMTESEKHIFEEYKIKPLFLPFYNEYSTTHLINQVEANLKGLKCICADRLSKKEN